MNLADFDLIPSVIISDVDDEHLGRVKCTVPGYLNGDTMSVKRMPWVYPFAMAGYQHFSRPIKGQKVWVLKNIRTENQYWYIPMFEFNEMTEGYINEDENTYKSDHPEVVFSRKSGGYEGIMIYDDNNGIRQIVNGNRIQIHPNGDIEVESDGTVVKIHDHKVYIGSDDGSGYEPAIKGKQLSNLFSKLNEAFTLLHEAASKNPYTGALEPGFMKCKLATSNDEVKKTLCNNTEVN